MKHIILFSSALATDGLEETPIKLVDLVGVANDDMAAIDAIQAHYEGDVRSGPPVVAWSGGNPEGLEYARSQGPDGNEIHAGVRIPRQGFHLLYRAIPRAA